MERRARQLLRQIRPFLPARGPVLDLGSGTGHFAAAIEQDVGLDVITADVVDIHVTGRPPVLIDDGMLPFKDKTFSASFLVFMLAYPDDPAAVLAEAARVTRGPIIVVQSLHATRFGYACLRVREFFWTYLAFHLSKLLGYVSPAATFTMRTRRFYSVDQLRRELQSAGLRICSRRERPILPDGSLFIAGWILEPDV